MCNIIHTCPPQFQNPKAEQMENSSQNPSFSICDIRIQKQISRSFGKSFTSENSFAKTSSTLKPHALPEYLEGRTQKRKSPFLFRRKRNIFLWCPPRLCEAVAGLIHSSSFRSKKVRAKCIITAPVVTCSELGI